MPPSSDDDLDWLYGPERSRPSQPAQPEPTQVMPATYRDEGAGSPPPPQYPPPLGAPQHYPAQPSAGQPYPGQQAYPGQVPGSPPPGQRVLPPSGARPPKKKRPVRNFFRAFAILLLLVIVWLVGVPAYAWSHVGRVNEAPAGERPGDQPGQTFLLVGSDSRKGLSKAQQKKLGTGSVEGQRTDTIMLVSIPPGGKPALISLPRDSYLPIPKNGTNKINAAYAFGGPKLLVATVEQNTGLQIDGYTEIGFGGFVTIIDALDGINMCLPSAIKDRDSHIDLRKGCQDLGGTDALGYVRMRKADPRGDLGRVERQRQMLAAIAKKGASPATVLNPVRYWKVTNATTDSIKLGQDTSFTQMVSLGLAMRKIASGGGLTLTVPIANPGASTPVGSAVLWDDAKAQKMFADIARGDTSNLSKYTK